MFCEEHIVQLAQEIDSVDLEKLSLGAISQFYDNITSAYNNINEMMNERGADASEEDEKTIDILFAKLESTHDKVSEMNRRFLVGVLSALDLDVLKTTVGFLNLDPQSDKPVTEVDIKWQELISRSETESDRSFVLIATSALEQRTKDIFEHALVFKSNSMRKDMFKFTGPFSSFSARIKLLYCLGLISDKTYEDLELIRKSRNKFAHSFEDLNLDSRGPAEIVERMSGNREVSSRSGFTSREWFIETVKTSFDMLSRAALLCDFQEHTDDSTPFVELLESVSLEREDELLDVYLRLWRLAEEYSEA